MTISSGPKLRSAGATTFSNVATYAPTPEPAGSGTLMLKPAPAPEPVSVIAPELGGKLLSWWIEIVSTFGSE